MQFEVVPEERSTIGRQSTRRAQAECVSGNARLPKQAVDELTRRGKVFKYKVQGTYLSAFEYFTLKRR